MLSARTLLQFAACWLFVLPSASEGKRSRERVYYVGIVEDWWDYAPSGKNLLNGKAIEDDVHASVFLKSGPRYVGSIYKKAMYRQYTDDTYSSLAPRPEWLGFLGPILRAEVDETIVVHLKNFASRNYSVHPHGVFYEKNTEGALYPDGTSDSLKKDDAVPPGGSYTYRWEVKPEFAPTDDDANCLTWVYHSHFDAPKDIASGLIGALLTCKKGILKTAKEIVPSKPESARNDVDQDVFLMFNVVDENLSWYLEDNIQNCSDPTGVDPDDPDFLESNLMHAINGYMFGNLPGIKLCQNRAVAWHLFGMGNEVDIHSAFFHGNTLLDRGHRTDVLSLFPATFATAEMTPKTGGKWLLTCQVNDHLQAGMQAFYEVRSCDAEASNKSMGGVVRSYYLAAKRALWSYAPSEMDLINNVSLTEAHSASEIFFGRDEGRIGGSYVKVIYIEYTDDTFTTEKPNPEHLGILGPVLRAEEGDTLRITFMNMADRSYSIQPHGLHYDKHFQGSSYEDGVNKPGSHVGPGENFTYVWQVLEGPSSSDSPCIPYLYYSATDPVQDTNSGLVGPLLVCKKGALTVEGTQKGVDKEFFLLFSVMDENMSWYLDDNIKMFGSIETNVDSESFEESNKMHAVNGLMYGNLHGLEMCAGDRVSWYTFGLGSEADIHGIYFEGNTFKKQSTTRDTVNLFPHTTAHVAMQPDIPGVHEVSCRVTDHYSAGMRQIYRVNHCPHKKVKHAHTHAQPTKTVQYFIAADEVEWDYSPERDWEFEKHHVTSEDSPGSIFVEKGANRIGSRYKKVVYREYTDDTFRVQKNRQPSQQHLGILGPIIKAEVGEQIEITFKNKASRPYSITAHGVKASGAHIPVSPGHILELTWDVPERSGPGITDPNCITYAYFSTVNFIKDLYSGLLGPLVICRPGTLKSGQGSDRQRSDVEKEFALLFMVYDENQSWYVEENIRTYIGVDPETFAPDEGFEESNLMHGINGKLYGNLHGLMMTQGQKVDWYLLGMGNEVDMHTVHFHAETFTYKTDRVHRADVFDLFPGTFQTVEMVAGNPGTWLLHCHVTDHIHAGMETTFTIKEMSSNAAVSGTEVSSKMVLFSLAFGLLVVGLIH